MAVYNGEKHLSEAVESVLNQKNSNFELICVDDGSTDSSANIIEFFNDERIVYLYQANSGSPAKGRNVGIGSSKGEYIVFLDQDDILKPDSLKVRLDWFSAHPDMSFLYSDCEIIDESGEVIEKSLINYTGKTPQSGNCFKALFKGIFIPIQGVMLRKSVFDKVGLLNEELVGTEDYEMWLRIAYNFEVGYLKTVWAQHRMHSTQLTKRNNVMEENFVACLESILELFPDAIKKIGRKETSQRMYKLSFDVMYYHYKEGNWVDARKWLMKCFKYKLRIKDLLRFLVLLGKH